MLQQTQVKTVIPFWERWLRELPTVQSLAECPEARLLKLWEGLGYYRRVRHLQLAARVIVEEQGGRFPEGFEAILKLPGIGRYTAGAISSLAFNQPRPILDGNVIRVLCRLFAIRGNPRDRTVNESLWRLAEQLVQAASAIKSARLNGPNGSLRFSGPCSVLNQSLMELGATVCTPRAPDCAQCPLRGSCAGNRLGIAESLPAAAADARPTQLTHVGFVVQRRGRYLVRQRPAGRVNGGLWEFPGVELDVGQTNNPAQLAGALGLRLVQPGPVVVVRHSITRYRITLEVYLAKIDQRNRAIKRAGEWLTLEALDALAFTSAHRKVLVRLKAASGAKPRLLRQSK